MALSAFDDKAHPPGDEDVAAVLGRSAALWDDLRNHMAREYEPCAESWGFAGKDWGWSLRLKQKKRTIVYLTPRSKHFVAGFALGEKAVRAAKASGLSKEVLAVISSAPKYAEGRGVRLEVRYKKDAEAVKILAAAKMST